MFFLGDNNVFCTYTYGFNAIWRLCWCYFAVFVGQHHEGSCADLIIPFQHDSSPWNTWCFIPFIWEKDAFNLNPVFSLLLSHLIATVSHLHPSSLCHLDTVAQAAIAVTAHSSFMLPSVSLTSCADPQC